MKCCAVGGVVKDRMVEEKGLSWHWIFIYHDFMQGFLIKFWVYGQHKLRTIRPVMFASLRSNVISVQCLWKVVLSQQRIRHLKILQSVYFAYDVGIISSYSNRIFDDTWSRF